MAILIALTLSVKAGAQSTSELKSDSFKVKSKISDFVKSNSKELKEDPIYDSLKKNPVKLPTIKKGSLKKFFSIKKRPDSTRIAKDDTSKSRKRIHLKGFSKDSLNNTKLASNTGIISKTKSLADSNHRSTYKSYFKRPRRDSTSKNGKGIFKRKKPDLKDSVLTKKYQNTKDKFSLKGSPGDSLKNEKALLDSNLRVEYHKTIDSSRSRLTKTFNLKNYNKDSLGTRAKDEIKKKFTLTKVRDGLFNKDLMVFDGSVLLESFNSTALIPYSGLSRNYQRITLDMTVDVLGLPLKTEGYFSTDKTGLYPSNMFRIYFDAESLEKDGREKLNPGKMVQTDALKYKLMEAKDREEAEIKNTQAFKNYYEQRRSYYEKNTRDQLTGLNLPKSDTLNNLINTDKYSTDYKIKVLDSLKKKRSGLNLPDTSSLRTYLNSLSELRRVDSCSAAANGKLKNIKEKWMADSMGIGSQLDKIKRKEAEYKNLRSKISSLPLAASIKSVQIGNINPKFSDLSVSGVSVKGYSAKVGGKAWSFEAFNGKTYNYKNTLKEGPTYDLPVSGAQIRGFIKDNEIFIHRIATDDVLPGGLQKSGVIIYGAGSNFSAFKNNLKGSYEIATVKTDRSTTIPYQSSNPENNQDSGLISIPISKISNYAFKGSLEYSAPLLGSVKLLHKNIQPGFDNYLVPFLRKDFKETQVQWQKKFFKNALTLKGSYKRLTDNLQNIKPATNKINGFGMEARGQFKNGLSLTLLYQPYDLSNNHPDTMYRTRNKFSVVQASAMLIVNNKKSMHVFSLTGLMNKTNYSGVLSQTYSVCAMANMTFRNKYTVEANSGLNFIPHNEDTLNYQSFGLNLGIKDIKIKKTGFQVSYLNSLMLYKANGYLYQTGFNVSTRIASGTTLGVVALMGINTNHTYQTDPQYYSLKLALSHPINYKVRSISKFKNNKQELKNKTPDTL